MFAVHMSSTIWHSGDGEGKWSESTSEGFMLADEWGSYTLVENAKDATHFEKLEDAQAFKERRAGGRRDAQRPWPCREPRSANGGIGRGGQGPRGRAAGEPRSANTRSRGSRGQPPSGSRAGPCGSRAAPWQVFAGRKV